MVPVPKGAMVKERLELTYHIDGFLGSVAVATAAPIVSNVLHPVQLVKVGQADLLHVNARC